MVPLTWRMVWLFQHFLLMHFILSIANGNVNHIFAVYIVCQSSLCEAYTLWCYVKRHCKAAKTFTIYSNIMYIV